MIAMRRRTSWLPTGALLLCLGCNDGSVLVKGSVSVDGEALESGRMIFSPVKGDGKQGLAAIQPDGTFQLRGGDSKTGAFPGTYRVTITQKPTLSDEQRKKISKQAAGLTVDELTVSYISPKDTPIVIPESGSDDLSIEITTKGRTAWDKIVSD